MQATFEFTREDYADLNQIVLERQLRPKRPPSDRRAGGFRPSWRLLGILGLVVVVLYGAYAALVVTTDGPQALYAELYAFSQTWVAWVIGGLLALVVLLLLLLLVLLAVIRLVMPGVTKKMISAEGSLLGRHLVRIEEAGVHIETPTANGFYAWRGVVDVDESPRHILLFVDTAAAVMVPKRAFPSDSEAASFLEQCRTLWLAGKQAALAAR
jgi:hypothetical protein